MSGASTQVDWPASHGQRAQIVKLGEDVGLRINPASITSAVQADRIIRQLMVLRGTGMAPYGMVHDNAFREKEEFKDEVI